MASAAKKLRYRQGGAVYGNLAYDLDRELRERELLENALENARRSEKTKHAFFNNMSHDMRTPLNAILGISELVRQHADDSDKVRGYMEKIYYSSRQ